MNRKLLKYSLGFMLVIAAMFMSVPFGQSLSPSEKAKAARYQYDISILKNGEYRFDEFEKNNSKETANYHSSNGFSSVLLLKTQHGELHVFMLPKNELGINLPDRFWGVGDDVHNCKDFRPTFQDEGLIKCHDSDMPEWIEKNWQWRLDGQSLNFSAPDLWSPNWEVKEKTLYINL